MEGNRNEEQEKGAEIRAILSFRDRSSCGMEGKACKKDVVYVIIAEAGCLRTVWQSVCP